MTVKFDSDGNMTPLSLVWEDDTVYEIDRVKDVRRAASLKAGGMGIRYTVMIRGQMKYFFLKIRNGLWRRSGKMCGRYTLFDEIENTEIDNMIREIMQNSPDVKIHTGEIFPTNTAPIIIAQGESLKLAPSVWGFPKFNTSGVIINARAETAADKNTFRDSLLKRRCIVPSTGFYEWDSEKRKYLFNLPGKRTLYMAGFWNNYEGVSRYVILTTAANESMKNVHNQMPVILLQDRMKMWMCDTDAAMRYLSSEMPKLSKSG